MTSDVNVTASTVVAIQGTAVSSAAPTDGYVLTYVGAHSQWEPKPLATPGISLPYAWTTLGESGSTGTSTTFADLTSTTITAVVTSVIQAIGHLSFYGNGSTGTDVAIRMVIDSQNGPEMRGSEIPGGSSSFPDSISANFISTSLSPGTYTIKLQWRNALGTGNVSCLSASISAVSLPQ